MTCSAVRRGWLAPDREFSADMVKGSPRSLDGQGSLFVCQSLTASHDARLMESVGCAATVLNHSTRRQGDVGAVWKGSRKWLDGSRGIPGGTPWRVPRLIRRLGEL